MAKLSRIEIFELQKKVQARRKELADQKETSIEGIFEFIKMVELLNAQVRRLKRSLPPDDPLLVSSEDVLSFSAHSILLGARNQGQEQTGLVSNYRRVWRENISLFLFTMALFLISSILGYSMTLAEPDYSSLFIDQGTIENILDKQAWFERIRSNPLWYGFLIAVNNIKVSLLAFSLGAVAGLGGIYILMINGLMLGSIIAFCQIYNFDDALLTFIVGHGPLELTMIVASVFGSFIFGRSFYHRPFSEIPKLMKKNAQDALYVLLVISSWLVIAAVIEVGVSPYDYLTPKNKIFVGLLAAAAFWYWTFKKEPQEVNEARKR